jgi:endoglucanase
MFHWLIRVSHRVLGFVFITAMLPILGCEASPNQISLLDPAEISGNVLQPLNAKVEQSKSESPELIVRTQANQDYPGVSIQSSKGEWNLAKTPIVSMTVRNLSDRPLDVMMSLENETSDGQKGCSAQKVQILEGETSVLSLVLGDWYGNRSDTFDPTQVARINVIIDRHEKPTSFSIVNIRASSVEQPIKHILESEYFANLEPFFGKGVNIGNTLEAPNEGDWGVSLQDGQLQIIREAGFDSIRLPVRWSAHAAEQSPYEIDSSFKRRVKSVVDEALEQGLRVVLNVHHYDEIFENPTEHRERFLGLWRQIASEYADYPPELAFEILNEAHGKLNSKLWNEMVAETTKIIRQSNPDRWIVIGGVEWNSVNGLPSLKLPKNDPKIALTFHYYSPMEVTHQGAPWIEDNAKKWLGTTWTGTPDEIKQVQLDFNKALTFGFEHKTPIYLGEFGVYQDADMDTRVNWTSAIRNAAVERKMGYSYWEFYSLFGLYDPVSKTWREPLKAAVLDQ